MADQAGTRDSGSRWLVFSRWVLGEFNKWAAEVQVVQLRVHSAQCLLSGPSSSPKRFCELAGACGAPTGWHSSTDRRKTQRLRYVEKLHCERAKPSEAGWIGGREHGQGCAGVLALAQLSRMRLTDATYRRATRSKIDGEAKALIAELVAWNARPVRSPCPSRPRSPTVSCGNTDQLV